MMRWLLERYVPRWAKAHLSIRPGGKPYIERYEMGKLFDTTVILHQYLGADGDRKLHNHPWSWCVGIPLVGGYLEERLVHLCPFTGPQIKLRHIWRFRPNVIHSTDFHRIARVTPGTWTLFVYGKWLGSWGVLEGLPPNATVFHQTDPEIRKYALEKLERIN